MRQRFQGLKIAVHATKQKQLSVKVAKVYHSFIHAGIIYKIKQHPAAQMLAHKSSA